MITRARRCVLVEGLAWVVGFFVVSTLLQLVIDYAGRLRVSMRAALLAIILGGLAWILWHRLIRPLRLRLGVAEAAHLVERKYPSLASELISAVRFSAGQAGDAASNSPVLMRAVVERAGQTAADLDFASVVNTQRARRAGLFLVVLLAVMAGGTFAWPEVAGTWFARNILLQDVEWWKRTTLIVDFEDQQITAARGDDLEVRARAQGIVPWQVEVLFESDSGSNGRDSMVAVGRDGFRYTFKAVEEPFSFRLRGGDDETRLYHVQLADRPRIESIRMRVTPPSYTALPAFDVEQGRRAVQVLLGSEIRLTAQTNKPVASARLVAGTETVAEVTPHSEGLTISIQPPESSTYHFALRDEGGLENRRPARLSIRVTKDEAPRARLVLAGVGEMVTPQAILPLEIDFADNLGLATAELVYQVSREGMAERPIPLPGFSPAAKTFATSLNWPVAAASVETGDQVTFLARASDYDDISGPNFGQSRELTLRLVSVEELQAELARREQDLRMQFERLVDAQEELRSRFLSAAARWETEGDDASLAAALTGFERRQRSLATSTNVVRQGFEQILAELRINQLAAPADGLPDETTRRLTEEIIDPLMLLGKREMVVVSDDLRQAARAVDEAALAGVDARLARILARMQAVLAGMVEWEGYQEVVNMLRDIVRLQQDLRSETKDQLERSAGDVFDD